MAVRPTMSALIAKVRMMVADPSSAVFQDQQIQDKLDECRTDVRYEALQARPTFSTLGIQYNDYYSRHSYWEADETLIWGDFSSLTPTASDEIVGHWTFNNQYPPVLLAGKYYDIYRAAADLLEEKIASLAATAIDFSSDGQTFHLSQQLAYLEKRVLEYRHKQKARSVQTRHNGRGTSQTDAFGIAPNQESLAGPVSANVPFLTGE